MIGKTATMSSRRCWVERLLTGYDKTRFRRNTSAAPTCIRGPTFREAHSEIRAKHACGGQFRAY